MLLILIILQTDYLLIPAPTRPSAALKFQPSVEEAKKRNSVKFSPTNDLFPLSSSWKPEMAAVRFVLLHVRDFPNWIFFQG